MSTTIMRAMAEYHVSSNRRLWSHLCQHLTDEQYAQPLGYSHGSLREQMLHLAQTDRYWLHDIQAKPVTGLNPDDYPTLASFAPVFDGVQQMVLDYVNSLDDRALAAVPNGLLETRWEALMHVFTHGTDHRAQVLSMLHGLGVPTFEQDFGDFRRSRRKVPKPVVLRLISFRLAEWRRFAAALPAQPETETPAGWTVKDTLAHFTFYERAMLEMLQTRRMPATADWARPRDERNQRVFEQHRTEPLAQMEADHAATHQALLQAIEALDDEAMNDPAWVAGAAPGTTPWMLLERYVWMHYLEHTEALWERLGLGPKP